MYPWDEGRILNDPSLVHNDNELAAKLQPKRKRFSISGKVLTNEECVKAIVEAQAATKAKNEKKPKKRKKSDAPKPTQPKPKKKKRKIVVSDDDSDD